MQRFFLGIKNDKKGINIMNNYGFTLIELLVVIAIIGTLATIGFIALTGSQQGASDAARIAEIRTVQSAITIASANNGGGNKFPVSSGTDGCGLLSTLPTTVTGNLNNINLSDTNYFYCSATGTAGAYTSDWYVLGAVGISNESHAVLTSTSEIDGNANGKIASAQATALTAVVSGTIAAATACNDAAGAAVLCVGVGV